MVTGLIAGALLLFFICNAVNDGLNIAESEVEWPLTFKSVIDSWGISSGAILFLLMWYAQVHQYNNVTKKVNKQIYEYKEKLGINLIADHGKNKVEKQGRSPTPADMNS